MSYKRGAPFGLAWANFEDGDYFFGSGLFRNVVFVEAISKGATRQAQELRRANLIAPRYLKCLLNEVFVQVVENHALWGEFEAAAFIFIIRCTR